MFNKVIMMGRLVTDPELRTTPQGVNVCSFRIAVDRRFQQKGEEKKSDFFNVVAWRQQADFVHRYFTKGRLILVEGEMTTRNRRKIAGRLLQRLCRVCTVRTCSPGSGSRRPGTAESRSGFRHRAHGRLPILMQFV